MRRFTNSLAWPLLLGSIVAVWANLAAAEEPDPAEIVELAAKIDTRIATRAKRVGLSLAAPAEEAEFLRRVHLDLTGTIGQDGRHGQDVGTN